MPPRNKLIPIAAALLAAAPLAAQAPAAAAPAPAPVAAAGGAAGVDVYRREVFRYQRGGRPDPFQALLTAADLGFRVEDLRLTSVVFSPNARMSLAVFAETNSPRRHRLKVGQRVGNMTVARIYPQRVDVRIDEFGGSRTETIQLQRAERRTEMAAEPAAAAAGAAQPQQIPVTLSPAQPAQERLRPLRRGPAPQPAGAAPAPAAPAPRSTTNPRSPTYTRPRP